MPLNVRRFCTSVVLGLVGLITFAAAQAPTANEAMRDRISKAKAFIAVRNYSAAIYELENIRKETNDPSVHAVTNVLLMNSYLERGDYKRAQEFLDGFFKSYKSNNAHAETYYYAAAGQVVSGARNRIERYRALGLNISDRNLPLEAANDLEQMRETLEQVVSQSKELGADKNKSAGAMALLEEASNSRSMMARDDYDARRWKEEIGDAREQMAVSRSRVINAVAAPADNLIAQNTSADAPAVPAATGEVPPVTPQQVSSPVAQPVGAPIFKPVADTKPAAPAEERSAEPSPESSEDKAAPAKREPRVQQPAKIVVSSAKKSEEKPEAATEEKPAEEAPAVSDAGPIDVGSLVPYAATKAQPVYPAAARTMRATGIVKVEVTVDEKGDVVEVRDATGHTLLLNAAKDAVMKWKFRPFVRDGQPVRATGFVNFNFTL